MGVFYSRHYTQFFPPPPTLTPSTLPSQKGKTFLITGGYSGVGYALAKLLYFTGAKIYIAGPNKSKALSAISSIVASPSPSHSHIELGQLEYLYLDLSDLSTIKESVREFMEKEDRLDILWNNAGVSQPPAGSVSKQGHELQMAVNVLGPYLLTRLLFPLLISTSQSLSPSPPTTRILFTTSQMVDLAAPLGGLDPTILTTPSTDQAANYTASKLGNWFLASEFAREGREQGQGVLCLAVNPGNLKTGLMRYLPRWVWGVLRVLLWPVLHDARLGALSEAWAGLSTDIGMNDSGGYVVPWGRMHPAPREDLLLALKSVEEGGTGVAGQFVARCEEMTRDYR